MGQGLREMGTVFIGYFWVLLLKKLMAKSLIGTDICKILVIDGYLNLYSLRISVYQFLLLLKAFINVMKNDSNYVIVFPTLNVLHGSHC